mgnify:CR=1 FL=1
MKKLTILFIILGVVVAFGAWTTIENKPDHLYRIVENNLFGYISFQGKVVINPEYQGAGEFSEGLAAVRKDGLYGYIDMNGAYAFEPRYDFASTTALLSLWRYKLN